jgi:hypothetical protein
MPKFERRVLPPEKTTEIARRHLVNGVPVRELCGAHNTGGCDR